MDFETQAAKDLDNAQYMLGLWQRALVDDRDAGKETDTATKMVIMYAQNVDMYRELAGRGISMPSAQKGR